MPKTIEAIFENGVFRPLEKVSVREHEKIRIVIPDSPEGENMQTGSLAGIIDIAADCTDKDLSVYHDRYLYGEARV